MNYHKIIKSHQALITAVLEQAERIIEKTNCIPEAALDTAADIMCACVDNMNASEFEPDDTDDDTDRDE